MKLDIKQRLVLLHILPKEGDITTLRIVKSLRENLSFTEEEHQLYHIQLAEGGRIRWDESVDGSKEVEVGRVASSIIQTALESLNKQNKLTEDHIWAWDTFVEET